MRFEDLDPAAQDFLINEPDEPISEILQIDPSLVFQVAEYLESQQRERLDELFDELVLQAQALHGPGSYALEYLIERLQSLKAQYRQPNPTKRRPLPYGTRKAVLERDGYRCRKCNDWHDLHVDHILPAVRGGGDELENLQTLCRTCNCRKGAK